MALRSSGFKPKKKREEPQPDGISVVRGRVKVRGAGYMRHLHEQQTPPLDLSAVMGDSPQFGKMERSPSVFSRSSGRRLQIRDTDYLSWLHQHGVRPLDIGIDWPRRGTIDLHHTQNVFGGSRRRNDASVVPLDSYHHMWIEDHPQFERDNCNERFALFSAMTYWRFRHRSSDDQLASAQDFAKWVFTKMAEEEGV